MAKIWKGKSLSYHDFLSSSNLWKIFMGKISRPLDQFILKEKKRKKQTRH